MPEGNFGHESIDLVTEVLADDDAVWCMALDVLTGEIEPSLQTMYPTDKIELMEFYEDVKGRTGASESQIDQAVERAKQKITETGGPYFE